MTMQLAPVQETKPSRLVRSVLAVQTRGPGFTDLTLPLRDFLARSDAADGLLTAFLQHTSASLTIQENADPDVRSDLLDALDGRVVKVDPVVQFAGHYRERRLVKLDEVGAGFHEGFELLVDHSGELPGEIDPVLVDLARTQVDCDR